MRRFCLFSKITKGEKQENNAPRKLAPSPRHTLAGIYVSDAFCPESVFPSGAADEMLASNE